FLSVGGFVVSLDERSMAFSNAEVIRFGRVDLYLLSKASFIAIVSTSAYVLSGMGTSILMKKKGTQLTQLASQSPFCACVGLWFLSFPPLAKAILVGRIDFPRTRGQGIPTCLTVNVPLEFCVTLVMPSFLSRSL